MNAAAGKPEAQAEGLCVASPETTPHSLGSRLADVARELRPYNHAGLCDPAARNMYRFTAAPVCNTTRFHGDAKGST
jgi:hypothetical protein